MIFNTELQLAGIVKQALPLESGTSNSGKAWRKQTYIIDTTTGNYAKCCAVTVWGDNIDKMNLPALIDSEVLLALDVESREFNGRYYTEIRAIRLISSEVVAESATPTTAQPQRPQTAQPQQQRPQPQDDLPF